jgi:hypothetical protein
MMSKKDEGLKVEKEFVCGSEVQLRRETPDEAYRRGYFDGYWAAYYALPIHKRCWAKVERFLTVLRLWCDGWRMRLDPKDHPEATGYLPPSYKGFQDSQDIPRY